MSVMEGTDFEKLRTLAPCTSEDVKYQELYLWYSLVNEEPGYRNIRRMPGRRTAAYTKQNRMVTSEQSYRNRTLYNDI